MTHGIIRFTSLILALLPTSKSNHTNLHRLVVFALPTIRHSVLPLRKKITGLTKHQYYRIVRTIVTSFHFNALNIIPDLHSTSILSPSTTDYIPLILMYTVIFIMPTSVNFSLTSDQDPKWDSMYATSVTYQLPTEQSPILVQYKVLPLTRNIAGRNTSAKHHHQGGKFYKNPLQSPIITQLPSKIVPVISIIKICPFYNPQISTRIPLYGDWIHMYVHFNNAHITTIRHQVNIDISQSLTTLHRLIHYAPYPTLSSIISFYSLPTTFSIYMIEITTQLSQEPLTIQLLHKKLPLSKILDDTT